MSYASTRDCVNDLKNVDELLVIDDEVSPDLEIAAIHRQVFANGGPALLFTKVQGSRFSCSSNIFGTQRRCDYIFRDSFKDVANLIRLKGEPQNILRQPITWPGIAKSALHAIAIPTWKAPVMQHQMLSRDELPQIKSWPMDGGAFITLPQVYTAPLGQHSPYKTNCGMYRIQISGGCYEKDEFGLHYQIHRGIGVHHQQYLQAGRSFPVTIAIGGPPAHALAAVMPLPEGLPEIAFAGALANRNFRYSYWQNHLISAEADFVIVGDVLPQNLKSEGPFGDHLGYYSLAHPYPVLKIRRIFYRENAIWPLTVVGRPPQEDSFFGKMIHDLTVPMVQHITPGLKQIHAVDEAGVHPLLLAVGSERYVPYEARRPREILTQANAILGYGQCSLAKYLFIAAHEDAPNLSARQTEAFFHHVLERVQWQRDLHFQTETTIDSLDYSGPALNQGSKVVIAAAGEALRILGTIAPSQFLNPPTPWRSPTLVSKGILAIAGSHFQDQNRAEHERAELASWLSLIPEISNFPLLILCDEPQLMQGNFKEFLWVTFTRSNPSHDIDGIHAQTKHKHWGCGDVLIIDARSKPQHAPALVEDPDTLEKIKKLCLSNRSLSKWCSF